MLSNRKAPNKPTEELNSNSESGRAPLTVDIAIVGGGVVGFSLALGLAKLGRSNSSPPTEGHADKPQQMPLRVALIDAADAPTASSAKFDQRTIALSKSSVELLQKLEVRLADIKRSPIKHIHVSDQSHSGQTRLHASENNIDAFGYVVSLDELGSGVYKDLAPYLKLDTSAVSKKTNAGHQAVYYLPATKVENVERSVKCCNLALDNQQTINAELVVLADGGRSSLAEKLGLTKVQSDYAQTAFTFVTSTSEPHDNWAYERFTKHGPLAFLPLDEKLFGVVWTVDNTEVSSLKTLSDKDFIARIQKEFGYRRGVITHISQRETFPLALRYLQSPVAHRVVAIGNAAQTLHPIAGQGINLGLRDTQDLANAIAHHFHENLSIHEYVDNDANVFQCLSQYQAKRTHDRDATISLTDGLVRVFSNPYEALIAGRNIGLTGLNISSFAKAKFAEHAMGYRNATL